MSKANKKARRIVKALANSGPHMKRVPGFLGDYRCAICECATRDDEGPQHFSDCTWQLARTWCNKNGW